MSDLGLVDAGFSVLAVDDGMVEKTRNSSGFLVPDASHFPTKSLLPLSMYAASRNMTFGVYTDRGSHTCQQRAGSLGFEGVDAEWFLSEGGEALSLVKNDDCNTAFNYTAAAYRYGLMRKALDEATPPGHRRVHQNIKAPDTSPEQARLVCDARRVAKDVKGDWENVIRVVDTAYDPAYLNASEDTPSGAGFLNDLDMLELNIPALSTTEQISHVALWVIFRSPLMIGTNPASFPKETIALLTNSALGRVWRDPLRKPPRKVSTSSTTQHQPFRNGTKVLFGDCPSPTSPLFPAFNFSYSENRIIHNPSGLCLTIWGCQARWPWWISVENCVDVEENDGVGEEERYKAGKSARILWDGGKKEEVARAEEEFPDIAAHVKQLKELQDPPSGNVCPKYKVQPGTNQLWKWDVGNTSRIQSLQNPKPACWPPLTYPPPTHNPAECCLSAEGANLELDGCGWSNNPTRQEFFHPPGSSNLFKLSFWGVEKCMQVGGTLEAYAVELSDGSAAVLFLNRSPFTEDITATWEAVFGKTVSTCAIEDVLTQTSNGTATTQFTAKQVPSHGVVLIRATPQ